MTTITIHVPLLSMDKLMRFFNALRELGLRIYYKDDGTYEAHE